MSLTLCSVSLLLLSFVTNPGAKAATHGSPSSRSSVQQTQQPAPDAITLDLNVPLERDLIAGQKHEYQMTLAEGQYANVTVEQRGIDVIVRLIGPDDKQIAEFDSESRLKGEEKVELVAKIAGRYRLVVEAKQPKAAAGGYTVRLDGLRVATERDRSLQEARRLSAECVGLRGAGKFSEALALGERALEIRERTVGKDHPDVAQSLFNLANIHKDQGDFDKAEDLYRRALEIREKALGREHPHVAQALNNLAILYKDKGDFANAEQFNRCALDILEKALGPEHPAVAGSLGNLAEVARLRGNYTDAEDLNQRSIEILQKSLGPEHPSVAISVNNLANVYKHKGDLVKAEQLYRRALEILQKRLGPEHPNVAALIGNLGEVARLRGDYTTAEQLNQRVLEILEKRLGPEHPNVAFARGNLAMVYRSKGDFIKAEELYRSEREILEKTLGPEHPEVADTLNNLAILYKDKGDFAKAETLHQRALQIREKSLGPEHPEVAESLSNLATLYTARGEFDQAITSQLRANEITEHNIALNLATGSERQKLAYLTSLSEITDRTLSLHARATPDNSQAQELAATIILQRKGRVLDAMSDSSATLRRRLTAQDHTLLDQLSSATAQLARLVLNGPQKMTFDAHQKRIRALEEEREKLESKISRSSAGFYEPAVPVTLAAVRASIPADAALVEFSAYRPFDPKAGDAKAYGDPRYVACVLRPQGEIQWKELGEAREIDEVIDALRKALRDPQRGDVRRLARSIDEKVMRPVRALLGDATHLLVSPDGALNLIPFEAFVDEQNRYLVERYAFTYLTSGRDLMRLQVPRQSLSNAIVMANPLYGEPETSAIAQATAMKARPSKTIVKRQSVTTGSDLSNVYFAPLSATAQEAKAIKAQFPDATVMTGMQATESSLKQIAAPRLIHIATHGFFLQDGPTDSVGPKRSPTRSINANVKIENPLLRSGLALAGANLHQGGEDDGVLTALEASGLNLWGTKLVVLSACDTGVGEVKTGEGVYGLRRAFVLAGTESLVMSLWPVSDYMTREMMTAYYKGLREGRGRGEALRQVQLSMFKHKGREHPFYWAGFIQSGEWANLDGKR